MSGISNFQIEETFKKIDDEDLLENFVDVFLSSRISRFINHAAMISDRGKYPFIIANTDAEGKPGVHWWSILDIEPRNDIFFFDSFGIEGLKHFIIQDDKKTVEEILLGIEKMDRSDNKITLCKIKFNMRAYKKLSQEEIHSLSETARNFFLLYSCFWNKTKAEEFCTRLDGRGQHAKFRLRYLRNISNILLRKVVQSRQKQQDSKWNETKKRYCGKAIKRIIFSRRCWKRTENGTLRWNNNPQLKSKIYSSLPFPIKGKLNRTAISWVVVGTIKTRHNTSSYVTHGIDPLQ